jgi:cystathionine beta-synthase
MARQEGILAGGSTGSVLAGTRQLLTDLQQDGALEGKVIALMAHDGGRNYLSKFYNDDWMKEQGYGLEGDSQ